MPVIQPQSPIYCFKVAEKVLEKTHNSLVVGSDNISTIKKHEHPLVDSITISQELHTIRKVHERSKLNALNLFTMQKDDQRRLRSIINTDNNSHRANQKVQFMRHLQTVVKWPQKYQVLHNFLIARLALEFGIGNCGELVILAMFFLKEMKYEGLMEYIQFENFHHSFVVLNRPLGSNIADYRTWGKDTIILDPWLNVVCTADEFLSFWKNKLPFLLRSENGMQKSNEDFKHKISTEYDANLLVTRKIFDGEMLFSSSNKDKFTSFEAYEEYLTDSQWAAKLFKHVPGVIALRLAALFKIIFGESFINSTIASASDFIKTLDSIHLSEQFEYTASGGNDDGIILYKNEYQSNTATPEQIICYLLTTTDIKTVDTIKALNACHSISDCLSPGLIRNIETLCAIISLSQKVDNDHDKMAEILACLPKLDGQAYINLQGIKDFSHLENLYKISLQGSYLAQMDFSESKINFCNFSSANLYGCNFSNAILDTCLFLGGNLSSINLKDAMLSHCDFSRCNLSNAILIRVDLKSNSFAGASLAGAVFIPDGIFINENILFEYLDRFYKELSDHPQADILTIAIANNIIRSITTVFADDLQTPLQILNSISQHDLFNKILAKQDQSMPYSLAKNKNENVAEKALNILNECKMDLNSKLTLTQKIC